MIKKEKLINLLQDNIYKKTQTTKRESVGNI